MMSFVVRFVSNELTTPSKSLLLLGPRQTGKSTQLKAICPAAMQIKLADEGTYLDFAADPRRLEKVLGAMVGKEEVFIDEIQRLPSLLNTI